MKRFLIISVGFLLVVYPSKIGQEEGGEIEGHLTRSETSKKVDSTVFVPNVNQSVSQ